jgi:hypothetical protein
LVAGSDVLFGEKLEMSVEGMPCQEVEACKIRLFACVETAIVRTTIYTGRNDVLHDTLALSSRTRSLPLDLCRSFLGDGDMGLRFVCFSQCQDGAGQSRQCSHTSDGTVESKSIPSDRSSASALCPGHPVDFQHSLNQQRHDDGKFPLLKIETSRHHITDKGTSWGLFFHFRKEEQELSARGVRRPRTLLG